MIKVQLALVAALVLLASAYTEESHVLILTDDDFPSITTEFEYIMIEFYAPWCGHCKKLSPIYDQIAQELHSTGSVVRVAKIDCDQYSKAKGTYQVQGFPTLIFFIKGEQVKYSGGRTKEVMINWMTKKTQDAVIATTEADLESVVSNGKVNIVFHGDITSESGAVISSLAKGDDYNTYYHVADSTKEAGTVQIYRPFGETVSYASDDKVKEYIQRYERPSVQDFDDRTIGEIFGDSQPGLILFGSETETESVSNTFKQAAEKWNGESKKVIFTEIAASNQHYKNLANYIKTNPASAPLVYILASNKAKYVLTGNPLELTVDQITTFLSSIEDKSAKKYNLDEQVKVETTQTNEEL